MPIEVPVHTANRKACPECQSKDSFRTPIGESFRMQIEALVHNANRKACPECQSKGFFRAPIEGSFKMPIEVLVQNANRKACPECQSKGSFRAPIEMYLKHHSKIFLFFKQEFMINHAKGKTLGNMRGQILGCNNCPCSIFLNLRI